MKIWNFLSNTFALIGKKSFAKALKISTYHLAQLDLRKADPFILPMYTSYKVVHNNLDAAYNRWKMQGGVQKGSTLSVKQLLKLLVDDKLVRWEYAIMGLHLPGTPNFVSLFPKGRSSFNSGTIDARINAVGQLGAALEGITELATTKTDVDDFFVQITNARSVQLGQKGGTESKSGELENAVEAAMVAMYGNLGLLMNHYKTDVKQIEAYFDLPTIRYQEQTVYKKMVATEGVVSIVENTFTETDKVHIINDGEVTLGFYLAATADAPAPEPMPLVISSHQDRVLYVSTLGSLSNRFLKASNDFGTKGHCIIELM
jgi:hypothetical protein